VTLTAKDVAEITRLLEESTFDELHLEIDGLKLHLKRGAAVLAQPTTDSAAVVVPAPAGLRDAPADKPSDDDANLQAVHAPMLGTFYRAPKPGEPPFVEVGSRVEPDTIIGIIEVMKLINTVRSGVHGTVAEIPGRDGALVEYGETLLRVRRTAGP
jgi:acetyl-CoA carboxylase biotin carboxyl carrier protein